MSTEQCNWNEYLKDEESLNTMAYINNKFKSEVEFDYGDFYRISDFKLMGERYLNQSDTLNNWLFDPEFDADQMNLNIDRMNKSIDQINYLLGYNLDLFTDIHKYIELINYKDFIIKSEYDIIYSSMDWEEESTDEEDYNCCLLWARTEYVKQIYITMGEFKYNKILTKYFGNEFDEAIELFIDYIKDDLDDEMGI